jgi:hypothetical protein
MAAWQLVIIPKSKGGLGVLNLRLRCALIYDCNALLLKHLHKFYKENIPWVQLIWHKYYRNKVPHAAREVGLEIRSKG